MIKFLPYLSILIIFISCGSNETKLNEVSGYIKTTELHLDKNNKNSFHLDSIIDIIKVLPLETNSKSFLSRVSKVSFYNNNFYVLDKVRNKLCIFNSQGKFIGLVGNRGHGPGEYIDVSDFCIDKKGKQVLVLSVEKRSLYYYDLQGNHIKTNKLPLQAYALSLNENQELAFYISYFNEDFVNLKITDINVKKILYSGFGFPKNIRPADLTSITGGIRSNKLGFLYSDAISSNIYQIKNYGVEAYIKYRVNFGSSFVKEEEKYDFNTFFEGITKGRLSFLTNLYQENENTFVFTYNRASSNKKGIIIQEYNAYYNKNKKILYSTENLKKSFLSTKLSGPLGKTDRDKFISMIEPIDYLNYAKDNENVYVNNKELKDVIKNIKEEDNPILIVYDFKK